MEEWLREKERYISSHYLICAKFNSHAACRPLPQMLSSVTMYWVGEREGEERGGEGRGGESGSGCEESNVSTGQQRIAKLTTFFPLWGGMNLGWMKEQPLARASNGPGPGGR